jgi:exonuclease I
MKLSLIATSLIVGLLTTENPVSQSRVTQTLLHEMGINRAQLLMVKSDMERYKTQIGYDLRRLDAELKRFDAYRELRQPRLASHQTPSIRQALSDAAR